MGDSESLVRYLNICLPHYLDDLSQLCSIECPSSFAEGVNQAARWVRDWTESRGWAVRLLPGNDGAGESVVASIDGGDPEGPRILLVAHLDTVYPVGTAAQRPLSVLDDRIVGPGTADNKSGLLSGLYAMAALDDQEFLGTLGRITIICGSDEETDMRSSGPLIRELAECHDLALVLECGRENGDIVSARKGSGHYRVEVTGQSAHAGVEPHRGAHAILALAQQIVALQLLNGTRPGVTVNVGIIRGGTVINAIPDHASAEIDVRVTQPEDMGPVGAAIAQIVQTSYVYGTTSTLIGGWRMPPMARTPDIERLVHLAGRCAQELGFSIRDASTGGISYANLLAELGLPVLDGLGPVGGLDHSPNEYILQSSIVPRTALLALLMLRRSQT